MTLPPFEDRRGETPLVCRWQPMSFYAIIETIGKAIDGIGVPGDRW
jgi:hypothetical protein